MARRKGWHRKKRRLHHNHKAQALGMLRNHCRRHFTRWAETLYASDDGKSPLMAAFQVPEKLLLGDGEGISSAVAAREYNEQFYGAPKP